MRKIKLLLLLSTSLCANLASAQNGLYAAVEGGIAPLGGLPSPASAGAINLDRGFAPNAIRFSGGYNHDITHLFGIGFEAAFGWFGNAVYEYPNGASTRITSTIVEFMVTGSLHISPKFDAIIKIGGNRFSPYVRGLNAGPDVTNIAFQTGITGAYNLTSHFALTLAYMHIFGSSITSVNAIGWKQKPSVNVGLLGLRYNFGS